MSLTSRSFILVLAFICLVSCETLEDLKKLQENLKKQQEEITQQLEGLKKQREELDEKYEKDKQELTESLNQWKTDYIERSHTRTKNFYGKDNP